jgi:hypothetical protein
MYLSAVDTAWREVKHHWKANPAAYRMARVQVRLNKIADLTDREIRKTYGVDKETLQNRDYDATERLARRLRADGFEGIWTYSHADQPNGRCLVVFLDRLSEGSRIEVVEIVQVAQVVKDL